MSLQKGSRNWLRAWPITIPLPNQLSNAWHQAELKPFQLGHFALSWHQKSKPHIRKVLSRFSMPINPLAFFFVAAAVEEVNVCCGDL